MTPLLLLDTGRQTSGTANPGEIAIPGDGAFAELVDGPASQNAPPAQVADETAVEADIVPDTDDTVPEPVVGLVNVAEPPTKPTAPTASEVAKAEPKPVKDVIPAKGAVPTQSAVQVIVESRMPREQAKTDVKPTMTVAETTQAGRLPDAAGAEPETRLPMTVKAPQQTAEMHVQQPKMPTGEQQISIQTPSKVEKNGERQVVIPDVTQPDVDVPKPPTTSAAITAVSTGAPMVMLDLEKQATNKALAETEVVAGFVTSERSGPTLTPTITAVTTAMPAQTGQQVAHQIATAMTQQGGRATEIALNPEELGRVRLSMTAQDTTITLNVLAERPETTDLLRRNIEALEQEFRAMGYDNINFSFGADGDRQADADDGPDVVMQDADIIDDTTTQTALQPSSGLDLRM